MNEALQTEDNDTAAAPVETANDQPTETAEGGAELAPANQGQELTEAARKAINKQHKKFRDQERETKSEREKRIAAENELAKIKAEQGEVVIPPVPDSFDENYDEKVAARDEAIRQKAANDAETNRVKEAKEAETVTAQQEKELETRKLLQNYGRNAQTQGFDIDEIDKACDILVDYGIRGDLGTHILADKEYGPAITMYLASNPEVFEELNNMPLISAGLFIENKIKPAAATLKPQASDAPAPAERLDGRGAGEQEDPILRGATFE